MPSIKANNIDIYYEIHGQGEPLLLIGGVGTDTMIWLAALPYLTEHYQVILFDNRGAGKTEASSGPYSTQMMAEDTVALLDALNIERAHVLGHSLGGAVAQVMALSYPQIINKLVLCGTFDKLNEVSKFAVMNSVKLLQSGCSLDMLVSHNMPWIYSAEFLGDPKKLSTLQERAMRNPNPQSLMGMQGQAAAVLSHDTSETVCGIKNPTLIIGASEDLITPARDNKRLAAKISGAQYELLEDTAHLFILERPGTFSNCVLNFLVS